MKYALFLPFFLLSSTVAGAQSANQTDGPFWLTHEQSMAWIADSTGIQGERFSIYRAIFFKAKEGEYTKFQGLSPKDVVATFGVPNKVSKRTTNHEHFTYCVHWLTPEYIELTLDISFTDGRLTDFGFWVNE